MGRGAKRRGEFWLAGGVFAAVTLVAGAVLAQGLPRVPTTGDRIVVGLESALLGIAAVAVLSLAARVGGSAYSQRNALRGAVQSSLVAPNGEEVVTFNNTLYGRHGNFALTVDAMGAARTGKLTSGEAKQTRLAGPWVIHFLVP